MDIASVILKEIEKRGSIKVADIVKATGFSRVYINRIFSKLRKARKVDLVGKTNRARYVLANPKELKKAKEKILTARRLLLNKNLSEDEVLDEIKRNSGIFENLPRNIISIADYAFTEILNNAIEHSKSGKIVVIMERTKNSVDFEIIDFGVGIFNNIMEKRGLNNRLEAIQDLLKGKQTTAPKEHTGEGIFFSSKAADRLIIQGSDKKLIFDNILDDVFVRDSKIKKGTKVKFEIRINSKTDLGKVFRDYSGDAFEFSKTKVIVDLYEMDNAYISRSQARRVLSGLEKFKTIILDFKGVETIGQAFADEVFRVWQAHHPKIKIDCQNTNENVLFMIKRALS